MQILKILGSFVFLALVSVNEAGAAVVLNPTFFYSQEEDADEEAGTSTEVKLTMYDVRLGYTIQGDIYIGGIYAHETKDSGSSETEITAYGASIGYFKMGWYLLGHYFLKTERKVGSASAETGDSGFQFDLGYLFPFSAVGIGPQLTYKKYEFKKQDDTTIDKSKERFIPMISVAILF